MPLPPQHNPHAGSDFEDFLRNEGRLEEPRALAIKRMEDWGLRGTLPNGLAQAMLLAIQQTVELGKGIDGAVTP